MATLITGGAGFVGLEVARQLLDAGEGTVTVFSRTPSPARLGGLAERVNVVAGDIGISPTCWMWARPQTRR